MIKVESVANCKLKLGLKAMAAAAARVADRVATGGGGNSFANWRLARCERGQRRYNLCCNV